MSRILIVEDDTNINNMIAEAFVKEGYECIQAFSGTEGLLYAKNDSFSLVIMDLMLPGMTGEELLPRIKEIKNIPVIILSAKDDLDGKINMLNAGAEDYVTKPFELKELIARAGVQIRRFSGSSETSGTLKYKDVVLNTERYCALIEGQEIALTKQEYKILELLFSYPDRVFSKQDIYDYAWDDVYIGEDKTINVHISNIRKKLKGISGSDYIETVWGIGFKLIR